MPTASAIGRQSVQPAAVQRLTYAVGPLSNVLKCANRPIRYTDNCFAIRWIVGPRVSLPGSPSGGLHSKGRYAWTCQPLVPSNCRGRFGGALAVVDPVYTLRFRGDKEVLAVSMDAG